MTLPGIGNSISFLQIRDEFGSVPTSPSGYSFGGYRISQEISGSGLTLPLDDDIPTSGIVSFSDFHSKRLNVVVDCYSGGTENRVNVKNAKWNNNQTIVVGGLTNRKEEGSRIRIAVNKKFGSQRGSVTNCALRTGSWDSTAQVVVEVAANGKILGAGGDGGTGAQRVNNTGQDGQVGGGALGIEASGTIVNVRSGGLILAGGGGGGGGGGQRETSGLWSDRKGSGGGGGGGAGLPPGLGAAGGSAGTAGSPGNAGSETSGDSGGGGGNNAGEAVGGTGGTGGNPGLAGGAGVRPSGGDGPDYPAPGQEGKWKNTPGGAGGAAGGAIRRTSGASFTIGTNNGTILGSTDQTGVT